MGVIGDGCPAKLQRDRVSPAWGLLAYSRGRYYPAHVFPLRAGVNGLLRAYHRYCLIPPEFGGCRAIEREPIFTDLGFSLLRGVNDVVGEGICHQ